MIASPAQSPVIIGDSRLTLADVATVAREYRPVTLGERARGRVRLSRAIVDALMRRNVKIYGITTGFASLRDRRIDAADAGRLSENLIRSHATGVGQPFPEDVVRAALLVRAHALALGYSGVRVELIETLLTLLNERIYPFVPQQGSVGSSGDLAPLSHLFLTVIGDPDARVHRRLIEPAQSSGAGLRRAQAEYIADARTEDFISLRDLGGAELPFTPLSLTAKEGLAANNGAVFAAVVAALAAYDAARICDASELIAALSFEALQAVPDCLDDAITASRPHPGHAISAANVRAALSGSTIVCGSRAGGLSGFNMARYNRATLALEEFTCRLTADESPDLAPVKKLSDFMRSFQSDVNEALETAREASAVTAVKSAKERELALCEVVFAPVRRQWHSYLGWPESDDDVAVELSHATIEELARIYHAHVRQIVRPEVNPDVQDNYSFRATPTVIGAARDAISAASATLEIEINSATDNPLVLLDRTLQLYGKDQGAGTVDPAAFDEWLDENWSLAADNVKSAANFHGEPVGFAAEQISLGLAEIGNISERRMATLMDQDQSKGLPSFLVWNPGLNSGLMMIQYTAASLVTENKTRLFPATADSIPTGENSEDHNSMATTAARNLADITTNVEQILALELFAAYQGVQFRKPARLGQRTAALEKLVAETLAEPLRVLGRWERSDAYRAQLEALGISAAAAAEVQPCVVDDITTYPALEALIALVRQGNVTAVTDHG